MPAHDVPLLVTVAVLGAGLLHALWNALLKGAAGEPLLDTAVIVAGAAAVCLPWLAVIPPPAPAAWPFVAASMLVHFAYYLTLAGAYRHGDLSFSYPLMRGGAPLLVTALGAATFDERLRLPALAGVALISVGVVTIGRSGTGRHAAGAARYALLNAAIIAAYTLIDGAGARLAGNPWSYAVWLMALQGVPYLAWVAATRGQAALAHARRRWRRGILGGAASVGAYAIALWAMTLAPIAVVAALREVSVVFAAAIGTLFLKERFGRVRLAGAVSVAAGIAALWL